MLRGIYSVASALNAATRNQEVVAGNLANVTTPGYRRQELIFELTTNDTNDSGGATPTVPSSSSNGRVVSHFDPAAMQLTGNPLDLAISGDGFFVLEGPNGPLYSRNGGFEIGPNGEVQTRGSGYRLTGEGGGALNLPVNSGPMTVGSDGTVTVNGAAVGKINIATFERPDDLQRVGATLFSGGSPQTPPPGAVRVEQGYREGSNVQPVQEMISMMFGMRQYEAAEKSLRALSDAIAQNTRQQQG